MVLVRPRIGGFTLLELLVTVAVVALLAGLILPALSGAREAGKLTACGTHLRELGRSMWQYAQGNSDVLPLNGLDWRYAGVGPRAIAAPSQETMPGWVGAIQRSVGGAAGLRKLACPNAITADPLITGTDYFPPRSDGPGSSWHMNAYCSGRVGTMIPAPADGVMLLEFGVWDAGCWDTGMLETPANPLSYPHPLAGSTAQSSLQAPWDWLEQARVRPRRNILWCDAHVSAHFAASWPGGDGTYDPDRIRHMAFGVQPLAAP